MVSLMIVYNCAGNVLPSIHVCTHVNVHLQWLEKDFLGYLDEWEASVRAREGFTKAEKKSMTLSKETLEGLRLTGIRIMYK